MATVMSGQKRTWLGRLNVALWHITSFRCDAEFGPLSSHSGPVRSLDFWVHGLIDFSGWSSRDCSVIALPFAGDVCRAAQNTCGVCAIISHFPIRWNRAPQPRRAFPGRGASPRSRLPIRSLRRTGQALRASGHAARDTNAQHVYPPFVKIEQVGIEQRTDEVLNHDHQADP